MSATLGDAIAAALVKHGSAAFVRATYNPRGAALARICEADEADRTWEPHWDQTPYRVFGPYS